MILKEIFEDLRIKKGVSVDDIADKTGISRSTLYNIKGGKTKRPNLKDVLIPLADYFGVDVKIFLSEPADTLAARVAELERQAKSAGPALHRISLDDGQRQYLHDKYIEKDVVSVAGRVDDLKPNALETLYRLLFLWDEIIRKGKVNDGRPKS